MANIRLRGFDGSTCVRTIRMLLAEKGATGDELVPRNVLKGDPRQPKHLARHPSGTVPVVEVDGLRLIESAAIARALDATLPGAARVPASPRDAVRIDM